MARGNHLYPSRTQKLSLLALMVLGWKRPGRVGRRRIPKKLLQNATASNFLSYKPSIHYRTGFLFSKPISTFDKYQVFPLSALP